MAKKYRMSDVDEMIKNILYPPKPRVDRQRLLQELLDMRRGVKTPPMQWEQEWDADDYWEWRLRQLWSMATLRGPGFLEGLGIPREKDPLTWTDYEAADVGEALDITPPLEELTEEGREAIAARKELPAFRQRWYEQWGVPPEERAHHEKVKTTIVPTARFEGAYFRGPSPEVKRLLSHKYFEEYRAQIRYPPRGVADPGIVAHEQAHATYFEDMPKSLFPLYVRAHARAMQQSPKYREAVEKYGRGAPRGYPKEQLGGMPTEAYATAYQYLGRQPEKMPWYMEPFYGKLMYPVPDLPGELEKSGLVWLASWLKDRIKKGAESVFREK